MLSNIHNKLSNNKLNTYDYFGALFLGVGIGSGAIWPAFVIVPLMVLSYKGISDDTTS